MFCDWLDVIIEKLIGNRSCKQKQKRLTSEPPAVSKIAMFLRFTQPKMKYPGGCETSKVANTLPNQKVIEFVTSDLAPNGNSVMELLWSHYNLFSARKELLSQANRVTLPTLCFFNFGFADSRYQTGKLGLKGKARPPPRQWPRDELDRTTDEELNETRESVDLSESISVIRLWPSYA